VGGGGRSGEGWRGGGEKIRDNGLEEGRGEK
jgi:hypothetical protein